VDPHHFDVDPDADPDSEFYLMRIRNYFMRMRIRLFTLMRILILHTVGSFRINAQTHEIVHKYAHIPYILALHLQIDADPDQAYNFDADPVRFFIFDADPDL
jgi:hypothetical protein